MGLVGFPFPLSKHSCILKQFVQFVHLQTQATSTCRKYEASGPPDQFDTAWPDREPDATATTATRHTITRCSVPVEPLDYSTTVVTLSLSVSFLAPSSDLLSLSLDLQLTRAKTTEAVAAQDQLVQH